MTTLIRPDNHQPAAYVTSRDGYVCLRTDCITPSVMWFSDAAIQAVNPLQGCELPPRAIVLWRPVVTLTPDMAASVNFAAGVEIRVAA